MNSLLSFWYRNKEKNILIEIKYNKIYDYDKLEKELKNIKGIISIYQTFNLSECMPDIIGLAHWNEKDINSRVNQIHKIPYISKIKLKRLTKI